MGGATRARDHLRNLVDSEEVSLPENLAKIARAALDQIGSQGRRQFEERVQIWVTRAKGEVDKRFTRIRGFDLGTTTCSAAIYDTETGQAVLCPWKGRDQFASTLSLDEHGNELVGLAGEEIFAWG